MKIQFISKYCIYYYFVSIELSHIKCSLRVGNQRNEMKLKKFQTKIMIIEYAS